MARVALDSLRPKFNCVVDVDFGPTTPWCIRYSLSSFLDMVDRRVIDGVFKTFGPCGFTATATYNGTDYDASYTGTSKTGLTWTNVNLTPVFDNIVSSPEFPACPIVDPDAPDPVTEDADLETTVNVPLSLTFSLFEPHSEQDYWDSATEIWLQFTPSFLSGNWLETYKCTGGDSGLVDNGDLPINFLGLDYTGGTAFPTATSSIPLGDGFVSAFFLDPGTADKLLITDIQTNN